MVKFASLLTAFVFGVTVGGLSIVSAVGPLPESIQLVSSKDGHHGEGHEKGHDEEYHDEGHDKKKKKGHGDDHHGKDHDKGHKKH